MCGTELLLCVVSVLPIGIVAQSRVPLDVLSVQRDPSEAVWGEAACVYGRGDPR